MGIGRQLKTKDKRQHRNVGLSSCPQPIVKLKAAIESGADTVIDLSTGDNLDFTRRTIIDASPVPIGTVPIYELACGEGDGVDLSEDAILAVIRRQAEQGVDYMTVHAGLRPDQLPAARARKLRIVSRGGALIARHMSENKCDNPFYSCFDRILDICREFDVTLSLGDGMRPGCLAAASDPAPLADLRELGLLAARCRAAGVQVMIEGPGHIPLDQVGFNMEIERVWCGDAPFYVLGPVVIDCSPGYDHISSAIGAAVAAMHGAAMLCYVTPKEHLVANARDVRDGVTPIRSPPTPAISPKAFPAPASATTRSATPAPHLTGRRSSTSRLIRPRPANCATRR